MAVPSSGPSKYSCVGARQFDIWGRMDGVKAWAVARKAIASAKRVEAAMVGVVEVEKRRDVCEFSW